jgi:hypothetical protein
MTSVAPMSMQQQQQQVPGAPPVVYEPGYAGAGRAGEGPGGGEAGGGGEGGIGPSAQSHPYTSAFAANEAANAAKRQTIAQNVAKENLGLAYGLRRGFGADNAPPTQTPSVPVAQDVRITGTPQTGSNLTGEYGYFDPNFDAEGASTYQWKRGGVAIPGATGRQHACVGADEHQVLTFTVTPVSSVAPTAGLPVTSAGVTVLPPAGAGGMQQPDFGFGS